MGSQQATRQREQVLDKNEHHGYYYICSNPQRARIQGPYSHHYGWLLCKGCKSSLRIPLAGLDVEQAKQQDS